MPGLVIIAARYLVRSQEKIPYRRKRKNEKAAAALSALPSSCILSAWVAAPTKSTKSENIFTLIMTHTPRKKPTARGVWYCGSRGAEGQCDIVLVVVYCGLKVNISKKRTVALCSPCTQELQ